MLKDSIRVKGTDFEFHRGDNPTLLKAWPLIIRLAKAEGLKFGYANGVHTVTYRGVVAELRVRTDVVQFEEIFLRSSKSVTLPENCVVWDIGGNVGMAALYFASKHQVKKVYTFEPFQATVQQMKRNLSLNPELSEKIAISMSGIEENTGAAQVFYSKEESVALSIYSDRSNLRDPNRRIENIDLRGATDVLNEICQTHPDQPIIIKMDCEGSEHKIVPALCASGSLKQVPILTMETHFANQQDIVQPLEQLGYTVFNFLNGEKTHGEVHAVFAGMR